MWDRRCQWVREASMTGAAPAVRGGAGPEGAAWSPRVWVRGWAGGGWGLCVCGDGVWVWEGGTDTRGVRRCGDSRGARRAWVCGHEGHRDARGTPKRAAVGWKPCACGGCERGHGHEWERAHERGGRAHTWVCGHT